MQSSSARARKAYATTALVMLSYARLFFLRWLLGEDYYQRRIGQLHERNAKRVKASILELNGLFVKVGQMLSILTNFLPEAFQKPLESLQDKIPARPIEQVKSRILRELGKPTEALFAQFDETPLAAASIGQVHRAVLFDGTQVAVKVQHADIEETARIDLQIIKRITQLISWIYAIKGTDYLYSQVKRMIEEELDFTREAHSMTRIREALKDETNILVPEVCSAYSSARVLTTVWCEGVKLANTQQIDAWGLDRSALAQTLLHAWCRMIFTDGFYHADPHPGNLLVQPGGKLVILDFGATGELSKNMRDGMAKLIECAIKNDTGGMIDACRSMGFISDERGAEQIAEKMINALRNFLQNEVQLEGLNFKDIKVNPFNNSLFDLIREIGISGVTGAVQVPKDYVLLNRAVMLILGLCNALDPGLNPLIVIRPYAQQSLLSHQGEVLSLVRNFIQGTLFNTLSIPEELRQTLQRARRGQIELRMPDVRDSARLIYLASRQWMMAAFCIGSLSLAYYFKERDLANNLRYAQAAALLFAFLFLKYWRAGNKVYRALQH